MIEEPEAASELVAEANGTSDQMDTEDSMQETEDVEPDLPVELQPQVRSSSTRTRHVDP